MVIRKARVVEGYQWYPPGDPRRTDDPPCGADATMCNISPVYWVLTGGEWTAVQPGDWLIKSEYGVEVVRDFAERFEIGD